MAGRLGFMFDAGASNYHQLFLVPMGFACSGLILALFFHPAPEAKPAVLEDASPDRRSVTSLVGRIIF